MVLKNVKKWSLLALLGLILTVQMFIQPITAFANIVEDKKYVSNQMTANYNDGKYSATLERYLAGGEYKEKYISNYIKVGIGESRAPFLCKNGDWVQTAPATHTDYTNLGWHYSDSDGYTGHLSYVTHSRTPGTRIDLVRPCTEGSRSFTYHRNDVWFSGMVEKDTRYYRYRGWAYAPVPDPTDSHVEPGTTPGRASGDFTWKLNKANDSSKSRVQLTNSASITGNHYATRNREYTISNSSIGTLRSGSPINHYVPNPNTVKNGGITYTFSYEYTNHRIDHYTCVSSRNDGCISWRYSHSTPDWSKVQTATFSDTLTADHKYGEDIVFAGTTSRSLIVGRTTRIDTMARSVFRERFNVDPLNTTLPTQSWKEIDEEVSYSSDLGNKLYALQGNRYYFPNDIDNNLKNTYQNGTTYNYSNYALPLRIGQHTNNRIKFLSQDNFYLTKNTGLVFSLPYNVTNTNTINQTAKSEYESFTGETYDDTVLTSPSQGSRYYLNTDMNGVQEPNVFYDDNVVVGELGLSDVTLNLIKNLSFEKYLFGMALDEAIVVQQQDTVLKNVNYTNSVRLTPEQVTNLKEIENNRGSLLHSFRTADNYDVYNKVKEIVPSFDQ